DGNRIETGDRRHEHRTRIVKRTGKIRRVFIVPEVDEIWVVRVKIGSELVCVIVQAAKDPKRHVVGAVTTISKDRYVRPRIRVKGVIDSANGMAWVVIVLMDDARDRDSVEKRSRVHDRISVSGRSNSD